MAPGLVTSIVGNDAACGVHATERQMEENQTKAPRGFAAMDAKRQREIARQGGESVPAEKRSFYKDRGLAAQAGRKGGESVPPEKRSFSQDRQRAADAGRKGGHSRSRPQH